MRFFSPSGELVGSEQRDGAVFRWMNGFGAAGAPEEIARLEISCVIKATEAGVYQLGVAGLGQFRLLVDGAEVFDDTLAMREGADVGETLMAPPQRLAPVDLAAGQAVAVRLEHDVHSSPMAASARSCSSTWRRRTAPTTRRSRRRSRRPPGAMWPWWWSAPPPRWRARASTARRWRCPGARTNWSAGWRRPTRGPWSW